jgi:hypothetical protein
MICLEKCEGTLDELFVKNKLTIDTAASVLFQIVMTLLMYQNAFQFTHNDLHTNNIMYVSTEEEYLYYNYKGTQYKVPTYGKIFKLIDFGRIIYKINGTTYCSDSFAPGGDAHTQYNFEPYYNPKKPENTRKHPKQSKTKIYFEVELHYHRVVLQLFLNK